MKIKAVFNLFTRLGKILIYDGWNSIFSPVLF